MESLIKKIKTFNNRSLKIKKSDLNLIIFYK